MASLHPDDTLDSLLRRSNDALRAARLDPDGPAGGAIGASTGSG